MKKLFKNKLALGFVGGFICIALIAAAVINSFGDPREVRAALAEDNFTEALSHYGQLMAEKPSARTAARMVDIAITYKSQSQLFRVLQNDIYPHLEVKGVREVFIQGGVSWLESTVGLSSNSCWLGEQLKLNGADITQQIRALYLKTPDLLWSYWVHELVGMDEECLEALAKGSMEYISTLPWPTPDLIDSNSQLAQAQTILEEAGVDSEMLNLWLNWPGMSASEFSRQVNNLSPPAPGSPQEPVYWLLRALILAEYLDNGWIHPLELDVKAELATIYPNLSPIPRQSMFQNMFVKVTPGSQDQLTFLMEIALGDQSDIKLDSPQQALELLNTLANNGVISQFMLALTDPDPKQEFMNLPPQLWSQDILMELAQVFHISWPENAELQVWAKVMEAVSKLPQPTLEIARRKDYQEITFPIYSSWSHPVLVFRDSRGVVMFDLESWQERVMPGDMCALSPDGSRLVVLEINVGSSTFSIYDMTGTELDRFTLNVDFNTRFYESSWNPNLIWEGADSLRVYYFGGTGYEPDFEDPYYYIEISSRTYTSSQEWHYFSSHTTIDQGLFRDDFWNLFDAEYNQIGSGGTSIDNGYDLGEDRKLLFRDGQIWFISPEGEKNITPPDITVEGLVKAGATEDIIYMELMCPPYWSDDSDTYRYSQATGILEKLSPRSWQVPDKLRGVNSGIGWFVAASGNNTLPLLIDSDNHIEVYWTGAQYYMMAFSEYAYHWSYYSAKAPLTIFQWK